MNLIAALGVAWHAQRSVNHAGGGPLAPILAEAVGRREVAEPESVKKYLDRLLKVMNIRIRRRHVTTGETQIDFECRWAGFDPCVPEIQAWWCTLDPSERRALVRLAPTVHAPFFKDWTTAK